MPNTITPNMSLIVPTIGQELSPTWATDINSSLSLIDSHDHTPGKGVLITPQALSITSDLSFQSNNAIALRSVRFTPQVSPLALGTDIGCLYEAGVDLYYNDANGNQIRITQSGSVVGTPGSIAGLVAPASVTYTTFNQRFTFQSNVNTSADIDGGSLTIRENIASAKGITLSSPSGLPADYAITLPTALPGSTLPVIMDTFGTLTLAQIVASQIANATITGTQIANNINLGGDQTLISSRSAVVSSETGSAVNMQIVQGNITSSGGLGNAIGIMGHNRTSMGIYVIVYTNSFSTNPSVTATALESGSHFRVVSIQTSNGLGCTVSIRDATDTLVDADFCITAIGVRS